MVRVVVAGAVAAAPLAALAHPIRADAAGPVTATSPTSIGTSTGTIDKHSTTTAPLEVKSTATGPITVDSSPIKTDSPSIPKPPTPSPTHKPTTPSPTHKPTTPSPTSEPTTPRPTTPRPTTTPPPPIDHNWPKPTDPWDDWDEERRRRDRMRDDDWFDNTPTRPLPPGTFGSS